MANEKYLNHYIETMTTTLTDCVVRNISMQANAKITDEVIEEQTEKIENLLKANSELQQQIEGVKRSNAASESAAIQELQKRLDQTIQDKESLNRQLSDLKTQYRDYESVKNQAGHIDTFKTELLRAREELSKVRNETESKINSVIAENNGKISVLTEKHNSEKNELLQQIEALNGKIDYLQLSPAKRKKIDELNNKEVVQSVSTLPVDDSSIKDGGSF